MSILKKISFIYRKYVRHIYYEVVTKIFGLFSKKIHVITIDKTISLILENKLSISRFGDGELRLMKGEAIEFQSYSPEIQQRLKEVILSDKKGHLVCLPDVFTSLQQYKPQAIYFWEFHLYKYFFSWLQLTNHQRQYGNAFITRPYITYKNYELSKSWFTGLKQLWNKKDVIFVEGAASRLGVGNDLFDNCNSIQRIICPSFNAFARYQQILAKVSELPKSNLILVALGPTATVLSYDLHKAGFQALDIGHVDIEYEWFLMKANWKVNIESKHTNEATNALPAVYVADLKYEKQIITVIE